MIDTLIGSWIEEVIKTQGVTLVFVFITSYWLMKRIEYLDKQIADNNEFMQQCIQDHMNGKETDVFRGR